MGVARTSAIPDFCQTCQADTGSWVDMNEKSQMIAKCTVCKNQKMPGALSRPMAPPPRQLGGQGEPEGRMLPVVASRLADVVPIRGGGQQSPEARTPDASAHTRRHVRPVDVEIFSTGADGIVARARTELAQLDAEIPAIEADLASAKAHRRGLAKMVAAYDRMNPRPVREPAGPPAPSRRMTRREARERDGG